MSGSQCGSAASAFGAALHTSCSRRNSAGLAESVIHRVGPSFGPSQDFKIPAEHIHYSETVCVLSENDVRCRLLLSTWDVAFCPSVDLFVFLLLSFPAKILAVVDANRSLTIHSTAAAAASTNCEQLILKRLRCDRVSTA